jgi:hypothetical protein
MRDPLDRGVEMVSPEELQQLAQDALARHLPDSGPWLHSQCHFDTPPGTDVRLEYPPLDQPNRQHLVLLLRRDGAVQVEWHVTGKKGSPFELFLPTDQDSVQAVIENAAQFIGDVLRDNLALAYCRGWIRGGRRFLERHEVPGARSDRRLLWIVSWNGTHDWERV